MKTYRPDYYYSFKCKADRCLHTCCAGWDICIDDKSLARFETDPDIASRMEDGCFVLRSDGRCPFLREDNLCEMILKHGEDYLCDICREHPRFYNTFTDHIEAGIGPVCEEACRLIIDHAGPFELIASDGSKTPLPEYVSSVFDGSIPLARRLLRLSSCRRTGSKMRAEVFAQMEVMDPKWSMLLDKVTASPLAEWQEDKFIEERKSEFANIAAYLLYRYKGAGRFAAESVYLLADLCLGGCDIYEALRLFSGEVEYSDINIEDALDTFSDDDELPAVRIGRMEALFDRTLNMVDNAKEKTDSFLEFQSNINILEEYYTGPLWKADLALDEAGMLPSDLKRGVLSEDGIYNLLDTYREIQETNKVN